jgi:hypothetical protein
MVEVRLNYYPFVWHDMPNREVSTFPPIFSKIGEVQPKVDFQRKVDFLQAVLSHLKYFRENKRKGGNLAIIGF